MTTKLIVGRIDDKEGPHKGQLTADSMALEIEEALNLVLPRRDVEDRRIRQKLAIAIARGVIRHLQSHQAAMTVTTGDFGGSSHEAIVKIDADLS